jgi:hypothetical protein
VHLLITAASGSSGGLDDPRNLAVFVAVVLTRLLLPLLMARYPLPVILACLLVDGVDQTVFQQLTDLNLDGYQSYDKALDIYYLSLAYLTTLRNWTNHAAYTIGAFLLYYRLVGIAIFEGLPEAADPSSPRWVLLLFPNTFEYFFIAYEAIRLRWDPARLSRPFLLWLAAGIWVLIKLPQEWWIHVAQLDTTDLVRANPWIGVLMGVGVLALAAVAWFLVLPRAPAPDHRWRLAADPLPESVDEVHERLAVRARRGVLDRVLAEEVALIGLLTFIFAAILPGVSLSLAQSAAWVAAIVVVDSAAARAAARLGRGFASPVAGFGVLVAVNVAVVLLLDRVLLDGALASQPLIIGGAPLFFVLLLTLIVVSFERYRPVHDVRFHLPQPAAGAPTAGGTPAGAGA